MDNIKNERKNPSRETCESIIKRILVTEVLTKGKNQQFKNASDFMNYFQSLYPASDALNKQVQRAIKNMNLPKDENGYLIINKTATQLEEEKTLSAFMTSSTATVNELEECEPLLLACAPEDAEYMLVLIKKCLTLQGKYETALPTSNGVLFYTKKKAQLVTLLESLLQN